MAEKTPLKAIYNEDNTVKSLAEFTVADYIGVQDGGTGVGELGSIVSVSYTHLTLPTTPYV